VEQQKETLHGRADLKAKSVYSLGLRPVRDDRPPRHVVIVDWPDEQHQKAKAQQLAAASAFVPRPTVGS
jgi:hypothetical protein